MSEFAVVINCKMNEDDNTFTSFVLDTINDTTVNSSSTMTSYPIVTGDIVSDHIYNNQDSLVLSGTFSLNGSKGIVINQEGAKLQSVQTLFEKIKKEGILCNIIKIHNTEFKDIRFKEHDNMVLTNISWTERINSLDFSFTFTETLLADISESTIDTNDKNLPDVTDPVTLNFTDTLIDWESIGTMVNRALNDNKLITVEFLTYLGGLTVANLVAIGVAAGVAAGIITLSVTGVFAIIGFAALIAYGLYNIIRQLKNKSTYKLEQFKLYKNEEKNRKEVKRYCNFQDEIHKNLLQLNNAIKVYNIGSDTNQECLLSIDNSYYIFTFIKNNTTGIYDLTIKDINEAVVKNFGQISSCPTNFSQLHSNNYLFRTEESGTYVYIICNNEDKKNLKNYYIVTSSMNLDNYNKVVAKIILNAMKY